MPIGGREGSGPDVMQKRKHEMKSIGDQLKKLEGENHKHSFGDAFIHQLIETIEFVLGTVSNTASYLRLWALSLAHGQLSEVFFSLILEKYVSIFDFAGLLKTDSHFKIIILTVIPAFIMWPVFWAITFSVIMLMDCMECFLHCLRLHWVEF